MMETGMSDLLLATGLLCVGLVALIYFGLQGTPHKKLDEDEHETMTRPTSPRLPHHRKGRK